MARPNAQDRSKHYWSQQVTDKSDALDLEHGVFKKRSARAIATSLKDSAEHSERRKADPFRSAMSMLTFYINRAGSNLPEDERAKLEKSKDELRVLYNKPTTGKTTKLGRKVEKPAEPKGGGPSGQHDLAIHNKGHTNK
jgi:hypothetical protein